MEDVTDGARRQGSRSRRRVMRCWQASEVTRVSAAVSIGLLLLVVATGCSSDRGFDGRRFCVHPGPAEAKAAVSVSIVQTSECGATADVQLVVRNNNAADCSGNIVASVSTGTPLVLHLAKSGSAYRGTWTTFDPSENPEDTVAYPPGETHERVRLPRLAPGRYFFRLALLCGTPLGNEFQVPFEVVTASA